MFEFEQQCDFDQTFQQGGYIGENGIAKMKVRIAISTPLLPIMGIGESSSRRPSFTSRLTKAFTVFMTFAAGPMYANPVINPDGTRLAIGTMQGVGVWDTVKKKPIVRFALSNSTMLDLSDNGKCLLGYASPLPKLVVWEMPR